jgi:hypothetical protein
VDKYSRQLEIRLSDGNSDAQHLESAVEFIVDELIFNTQLNRVFYNLIQMAFERVQLRDVMKKMFKEYRDRLALFLSETGVDRKDHSLGSAVVAMAEWFSMQVMVEPDAVNRSDVHRLILHTVKECMPGH